MKKPRVVLNDDQKEALRVAYETEPYPSNQTITDLARHLRLSVRTVVNWFHNHRMRLKVQAQLLLDRDQTEGSFESDIQNVLAVLQQASEDNDNDDGDGDDAMSNDGSYSNFNHTLPSERCFSKLEMDEDENNVEDDDDDDDKSMTPESYSDNNERIRMNLLERLENSVRHQEMSWDTEEDRNMAIARIEQHVHNEENAEWEF